ncbi:hypothetical protein Q2T43_00865 [Aeromonas veronii]|uniref:hypothetical protein n=1 Tax=Aeromonas veronii TaxID=654 RepID=UPI002664F04C|nr:hypothetical protein [Aeromonas veronii]MDO2434758.1 hypothetical protein [Aeromonas veronii]
MKRIKVVNVGPVEWFSPHFVYTDNDFLAYEYDPFKMDVTLLDYCKEKKPDVLIIFRGDLVRAQLYQLRHIVQVEFSSEIYPDRLLPNSLSSQRAYAKFLHCMNSINPFHKIYHYDESRKGFLDIIGLDVHYTALPVNDSVFKNIINTVKDIDILFFGRASLKRSQALNGLKECGIKFVWIENGLCWKELAGFIVRAKTIVNLSAEDIDNFEPRILLGLAGGCYILTERSIGLDLFLKKNIMLKKYVKLIQPNVESILDAYKSIDFDSLHNGYDLTLTKFLSSNQKLRDILFDVI